MFAPFSLSFYVFCLLAFATTTALTENRSYFWGWCVSWFTFIVICICNGVTLFTYLIEHPFKIVGFGAIYLVLGLIWGLCKWRLFLVERASKYYSIKSTYYGRHSFQPSRVLVGADLINWNNHIDRCNDSYRPFIGLAQTPKAAEYKEFIVAWIGFWPNNLVWTLISEYVTKIAKGLFGAVRNTFDKLAADVYKEIEASNREK